MASILLATTAITTTTKIMEKARSRRVRIGARTIIEVITTTTRVEEAEAVASTTTMVGPAVDLETVVAVDVGMDVGGAKDGEIEVINIRGTA